MSEPHPETPKRVCKPRKKVPQIKWAAPRRNSTEPDAAQTLEADQWKVDLVAGFGKSKTIFGSTSANLPGLTLVFYPGDQSKEPTEPGLPRVIVKHHSYRQAVSKMHLIVVGLVARLRAGEELVYDEGE